MKKQDYKNTNYKDYPGARSLSCPKIYLHQLNEIDSLRRRKEVVNKQIKGNLILIFLSLIF